VQGWANTFHAAPDTGVALRRAIAGALQSAGVLAAEIDHVNAHGSGTPAGDAVEAQAIHAVVPDVLVTAPKSYFGNLAAAGGAVEMIASVMAICEGLTPKTLNYCRPDPACPVRVLAGQPAPSVGSAALVINHSQMGQAAAVVLRRA
jgi:3-oxoacyl-[acyl-carrier-protein] synthase II